MIECFIVHEKMRVLKGRALCKACRTGDVETIREVLENSSTTVILERMDLVRAMVEAASCGQDQALSLLLESLEGAAYLTWDSKLINEALILVCDAMVMSKLGSRIDRTKALKCVQLLARDYGALVTPDAVSIYDSDEELATFLRELGSLRPTQEFEPGLKN
jgi:hypothetical protein